MAETLPRDFGPYVLEYLISDEGGQGKVYRATHKALGRSAVIKLLRRHLAEHESFVERFASEAAQLAKMDHANIVRVRQFRQLDGEYFIEMEYVEGWDLSTWIKAQGRVPVEVAVLMLQRIAAGLEHAHARFVIHRDVKPGNVILTPTGEVKVLDFGLAREMDVSGASTPGTLIGTIAYMSPEQVDGAEATESFDIYALGVVAYQLLAGRVPFEGGMATVCMKIRSEQPPPLAKACPEAPPELVKFVQRLMAKLPAERPAEMREVEASLREIALAMGIKSSEDLLARYVADPAAVARELEQRRRVRALRSRWPLLAGAAAIVLVAIVLTVTMGPGRWFVPALQSAAPDTTALVPAPDVPAVVEVLAAPDSLTTTATRPPTADSLLTAAQGAPVARAVTDAAVPESDEPTRPAPVTPSPASGTLFADPVAVVDTWSPDSVVIEVRVSPASDIYLDGVRVASGATAWRDRRLRKRWDVKVDGGPYGTRDQKKKPGPDDRTLAFTFNLSKAEGGVFVRGPRTGLDIYIDGLYQHAVTPAPIRPVAVGSHLIELRDRGTSTVVASRRVVVQQDSRNLEVDLSTSP